MPGSLVSYKETPLWLNTLGTSAPAVEGLRSAYLAIRENVKLLLGEIGRDAPSLTVHDISHIDALWGVASTLVGPGVSLNPLEGFVLGCSFLFHDAAQCVAAYKPANQQLLKSFSDEEVLLYFRRNHASEAKELTTRIFTDNTGREYPLIESPEVRDWLSGVIGEVAASHGRSLVDVVDKFKVQRNAPSRYPTTWTIDLLLLAGILRCADAAHIDSRRAPAVLGAIREVSKESLPHWQFQARYPPPRISQESLVYSSTQSFQTPLAEAWWLGFETVQMIDEELRRTDSIFSDYNRTRLAARSVAGASSPTAFAEYVGTDGWTPVEAKIHVGGVSQLVERLGGVELYGNDPLVPLRELVQNARDAIIERRRIENRSSKFGTINISVGVDAEGTFVEVGDDGVGMSTETVTGALLDFGASAWRASGSDSESRTIGRYGIGFFSVFMIAEKFRVITRHISESPGDTKCLRFENGLRSRPVLVRGVDDRTLTRPDPGTTVRLYLKKGIRLERFWDGPRRRYGSTAAAPSDAIASMFPALDVDVVYSDSPEPPITCIRAGDWLTIPAVELLARVAAIPPQNSAMMEELGKVAGRVATVFDQKGRALLRGALADISLRIVKDDDDEDDNHLSEAPTGLTTVEGVSIGYTHYFLGVLESQSVKAARDAARPIADRGLMGDWATEQLQAALRSGDVLSEELKSVGFMLGARMDNVPIAMSSAGLITLSEFEGLIKGAHEFVVVDSASVYLAERKYGEISLAEGVFVTGSGLVGVLQSSDRGRWSPSSYVAWPPTVRDMFEELTLEAALVEASSKSWNCELDAIWSNSLRTTDDVRHKKTIGVLSNGDSIVRSCDVFRRPNVGL
jgi:Histidine kinase-, DNA gyrase B-, and HSP90-like ATPase